MIRIVRSVGNHPFVIAWAGTIAAVAIIILPLFPLAYWRELAIEHTRETSADLCAIMSVDVERSNRFHDVQLQGMVRAAQDPRTWKLPTDLRNRLLFRDLPEDAYVDGEYLIDSTGKVILAHPSGQTHLDFSVTGRDYFNLQKQRTDVGLYISRPFYSRFSDNKPSIALTRRINKPDGSFGGIAFYQVRLAMFQKLFDKINTDAGGGVMIVRNDGTVLARKPFREKDVGSNIAHLPVFAQIASNNSGSVIGVSSDGSTRLFTYQHIPTVPLIAIVAPTLNSILSDWRKQANFTGCIVISFGAVLAVGSWLLAFALRDKLRAQDKLTRLATTDPLTQVSNRRTLEWRLKQEWGRARREHSPISILFIDIDHFKNFNDTYGHTAGDEVLAKVASRIASSAQRSIDIVARYGGEEFTVVLPGTDQDGAINLAEEMRRKIYDLDIANEGSSTGRVTVSIGCATHIPTNGGGPEELLAKADEQLYLAKSSGRNQVKSTVVNELTTVSAS